MSIPWSEADVGLAIRTLSECSDVDTACRKIARHLGRAVDKRSLNKVFARRDLGHASDWLKQLGLGAYVPPSDEEYAPFFGTSRTQETVFDRPSPEPERILVLGDCHFPWVSRPVWELMLRFARRYRPHRIIVLGDYVDAYSISSHSKDPNRVATFDQEVDAANAGLDELDDIGAVHKHFIEGNHCHRLVRLLMDKAPALYNQITIPKLLKLGERGWSFTPYRQHLKIGHVHYTHDLGNAGATAHTKAGQDFGGSVVIGHVHRLASTYFGDAHGKQHVAIAAGWLGDADACDYMHRITAARSWMNGWVTGVMEPDGTTHFQLHPVIQGKVRLGDEVIS